MIYEILFWFGILTIPAIVIGLLWIARNYGTVEQKALARSQARVNLKPWTWD